MYLNRPQSAVSDVQFRQDPGSTVFVGIEGRLDSFYEATLEHLGPDNCTVLYDETEVSDGMRASAVYKTASQRTHLTEHQSMAYVTSYVCLIVACMHVAPTPPCMHVTPRVCLHACGS